MGVRSSLSETFLQAPEENTTGEQWGEALPESANVTYFIKSWYCMGRLDSLNKIEIQARSARYDKPWVRCGERGSPVILPLARQHSLLSGLKANTQRHYWTNAFHEIYKMSGFQCPQYMLPEPVVRSVHPTCGIPRDIGTMPTDQWML